MILPSRLTARAIRAAMVPAAFLAVACSEPMSPDPAADTFTNSVVAKAISQADTTPVPRNVVVCKIGPAGTYSFDINASVPVGGFPGTTLVSDPFDLDADNCVLAYQASLTTLPNGDQPLVTMTITELDGPEDVVLDSVRILQEGVAPVKVAGPAASALVNRYHGAVIIFYNRLIPPPPPECHGLTPGYWKNWAHHYTSAEFQQLIDALPAPYNGMTAAQLVAILSYGGPNALLKLEKFYVANLLTLALTGTDLPNPSGGDLGPDCTLEEGDGTLGEAMEMALAILNNPGNYNNGQINAVKNILDAFANLNDD